MNTAIIPVEHVNTIKEHLFSGGSRQELTEHYNCSEATLTRFINKHMREHSPDGEKREWKGRYVVYSDGRIWSKTIFGWIKPHIDEDGYLTVGQDLGETKVHRLVLTVFEREPIEDEICRHLDGNPDNNNISTLQWSTQKQNQHDRVAMRRHHWFRNYDQEWRTTPKKPPCFTSRKKYGHDLGICTTFRQWRAASHCRFLHSYALAFEFEFGCVELDARGWVVDFGSLKPVKEWLFKTFDHTLLVAYDDPMRDALLGLDEAGLAKSILVQGTGCEAVAKMVFDYVEEWLVHAEYSPRVWLQSVRVDEHGANGASYRNWG